jgi:hypothetical protein
MTAKPVISTEPGYCAALFVSSVSFTAFPSIFGKMYDVPIFDTKSRLLEPVCQSAVLPVGSETVSVPMRTSSAFPNVWSAEEYYSMVKFEETSWPPITYARETVTGVPAASAVWGAALQCRSDTGGEGGVPGCTCTASALT